MVSPKKVLNGSKFSPEFIVKLVIFILVFAVFVVAVSAVLNHYFNPSNNRLVQYIVDYQTFAFVLYFAYVMVASVVIPIPTLPVDLVMINLLDPWSVVVVRLAGGLAGGSISFYLARNYGKSFLKRYLSEKNYNFIDHQSSNITWQEFFIITMLPVINAELMAYVAGVSKVKFRWTILILALAIFYRLVFIFFVIRV
jgi:uncharacterized membrane protein YdjX (TVP38/TMEM64 family)